MTKARENSDYTGLQGDLALKAPIANPVFTGNAGVGATSPSTSLHLKDNATAANTKLTVERSALSYTGEYAASHCGTVTNNEFDILTNNTIRMRIDAAGHVIIGGGVTLGNGNTYAAANTIDDYEEGTFTPSGTGIDASNSVGIYTKIGNVCHTQMWILANGSTYGTITGLPFSAGTGSANYICVGTIGYINGNVTGVVGNGATSTLTMYNGTSTGSMSSGNQMHLGIAFITA
jgi:hypothetical protein